MAVLHRIEPSFVPSLDENRVRSFVYQFYSVWDEITRPPDALLVLLHPDGCVLDLSLLGKFEGADGALTSWQDAQKVVQRASHHVQTISCGAAGPTLTASVAFIAQLEMKTGQLNCGSFESWITLAPDSNGQLKLTHYRVTDVKS